MQTIESSTSMSPSVRSVVDTRADAESTASRQNQRNAQRQEEVKQRERWQELIDQRLSEWGRDPTQLEDDGLEAPSKYTIAVAIKVAEVMRDDKLPAPTGVVPDAHRGIVFERRRNSALESVRIMPDGKIEVARFENGHLIQRYQLVPDSSITDD